MAKSDKKNYLPELPGKLRKLRGAKGVSQAVLAKKLGISRQAVGFYENGDRTPDAKTLHDLAVYFGVSADYLVGLSPTKTMNDNVQIAAKTTGLSEDAIAVIRKHRRTADMLSKLFEVEQGISMEFVLLCADRYIAYKKMKDGSLVDTPEGFGHIDALNKAGFVVTTPSRFARKLFDDATEKLKIMLDKIAKNEWERQEKD